MILIGVDPGKVTGISIWWDPDFYERAHALDVMEVDDSTKVTARIRERLDGARPHLMAVERFHQDPRKTSQPAASEVTGAVRSLAEELHVRCVYQSPSPAKRIASTALLKRLGWWFPTPDGHQNAATAHVLLLMATFMPVKFGQLTGI
jgi:hypothetical protein